MCNQYAHPAWLNNFTWPNTINYPLLLQYLNYQNYLISPNFVLSSLLLAFLCSVNINIFGNHTEIYLRDYRHIIDNYVPVSPKFFAITYQVYDFMPSIYLYDCCDGAHERGGNPTACCCCRAIYSYCCVCTIILEKCTKSQCCWVIERTNLYRLYPDITCEYLLNYYLGKYSTLLSWYQPRPGLGWMLIYSLFHPNCDSLCTLMGTACLEMNHCIYLTRLLADRLSPTVPNG